MFTFSGIYCEIGFLCISDKHIPTFKTFPIYLICCFMWKKPFKIKINKVSKNTLSIWTSLTKLLKLITKTKTVRLLFVTVKDQYVGLSFHFFL